VGGAQIKGNSQSDTGMGMKGDIRAVSNSHAFGFEYSTTLKGVLSSTANASDISYSKVGGFYLYRFSGKPMRAKWRPGIPAVEGESTVELPTSEDKEISLQAGFGIFSSSLQDAVAGARMSGVLGLVEVEKRFDSMRLLLGLDGGKSVFQGDVTVIGGNVGLFFESSPFVSQGLLLSYHTFSGTPVATVAGLPSVSYTAIFAGVSFQVKL